MISINELKIILKNIVFVPKCIFCRKVLSLKAEQLICSHCEEELPCTVLKKRCKKCGKPISATEEKCDYCSEYPFSAYTRMSSVYEYKDIAKDSILRFKHESYKSYSKEYARHMHALVKYDFDKVMFDIIVAVPPRKERMKTEGYDQGATLAKALAKEMKIKFVNNIFKLKEGKKQSDLSFDQRLDNVKNLYFLKDAKSIKGKTILLVDDICTTRATLAEVSKVLKGGGAEKVYCITIATA